MKAAIYKRYGPPDVLCITEVDKPKPKDNEVLVKLVASTVSAPDWRARKAEPRMIRLFMGLFKPKYPILGYEFAGDIEAVGKEVTLFKPGDSVFGENVIKGIVKFGAYAEYLCVPETGILSIKPTDINYGEAAAIPSGTLTAYYCLKAADVKPGQKVLINGSSGSIGTNAVQLAKYYGAEVTGVCSTAKVDFMKALGVDHVIDYTKENFVDADHKYDFILDAVGFSSFVKCSHLLTSTGCYLSTGLGSFFQNLYYILKTKKSTGKRALMFFSNATAKDLEFFKDLIAQNKLKPVVDRSFPLEEVAEAHRYTELGHKKGNVVIVIQDEGAAFQPTQE